MRISLAILATLVMLAATSLLWFDHARAPEEDLQEPQEYRLMFVGDIMLDRSVARMVREQGNGDWTFPLSPISSYLNEADFLFGNLESMVSDRGRNVGSMYSFRAHPDSMKALSDAGFSMVSVANNHSFDYTVQAVTDTMERLDDAGILHTGGGYNNEEAHSPAIFELPDGTIIGMLAYTAIGSSRWQATEETAGIAWMDTDRLDILERDINKTTMSADIVMVSMHFGDEYQPEPSHEQRLIGEAAIDAGADMVIGHHPHVLQPLEEYNGGWIAWSLGNFLFDQYFSEETLTGAILEATVKNGEISSVKMTETRQNEFFQVDLLNRLSQENQYNSGQ